MKYLLVMVIFGWTFFSPNVAQIPDDEGLGLLADTPQSSSTDRPPSSSLLPITTESSSTTQEPFSESSSTSVTSSTPTIIFSTAPSASTDLPTVAVTTSSTASSTTVSPGVPPQSQPSTVSIVASSTTEFTTLPSSLPTVASEVEKETGKPIVVYNNREICQMARPNKTNVKVYSPSRVNPCILTCTEMRYRFRVTKPDGQPCGAKAKCLNGNCFPDPEPGDEELCMNSHPNRRTIAKTSSPCRVLCIDADIERGLKKYLYARKPEGTPCPPTMNRPRYCRRGICSYRG